ncbi:HEAT repeat domain-containing protein [Streptomyces sp. NPDC051657]|uniref:HEAT repeat domain-containing protein n=1 Tax=unclassified Streptomyces TaxID=2593676 RepID=UPI003435B977
MTTEFDDDLMAGLDDIDWASLDHAYGYAEDVPGQLRQVCGDDDEARREAWRMLFSNVFHQGSRYTASPYTVPFFARIAIADPHAARSIALRMLKVLAVDWHDEYDLPGGIETVAWRRVAAEFRPEKMVACYDEEIVVESDPEKRRGLEQVRAYCAAGGTVDSRASALVCYDAVRAELPSLLCLLEDPSTDIRTRAAYLLAWFPEEGVRSVPGLLAQLERETDPRAAATALVAVGLVGDHTLVECIRSWLVAPEPLVRWGAATALARLVTTSPAAVTGLCGDGLVPDHRGAGASRGVPRSAVRRGFQRRQPPRIRHTLTRTARRPHLRRHLSSLFNRSRRCGPGG